MLPLAHFGVPVAEITLTLLLSLRFVSLVFDEVRDRLITDKVILMIDKSLSEVAFVTTIIMLMFLPFTKGIVCCQVRNVALGVVSRRINWQLLTTMETVDGKHPVTFATFIHQNTTILVEYLCSMRILLSWFVDMEIINLP